MPLKHPHWNQHKMPLKTEGYQGSEPSSAVDMLARSVDAAPEMADFDPEFYRDLYPDLNGLSAGELWQHWNRHGQSERRAGSLQSLLRQHGLENISWAKELFNASLYRELNPDIAAGLTTNAQALFHFVAKGIDESRPFQDETQFDYLFYCEYYSDITGMSAPEAYRHWLRHGIQEGRIGSPSILFSRLGLQMQQMPSAFCWQTYLDLNPDLKAGISSRWQAFEHLCTQGICQSRSTGIIGWTGAELLFTIARALRSKGRTEDAVPALHQAILLGSEFGAAYEELGNCYTDLGRPYDALAAYRSAHTLEGSSAWAYVNAANSLAQFDLYDGALDYLTRALKADPGWYHVRAVQRDLVQKRFDREMKMANAAALRQDYAEAQRLAQRAAECAGSASDYTPLQRPPEIRKGKIRIVALVDDVLRQCMHYRVRQKQEQASFSSIEYQYFPARDVKAFRNELPFADAALFYRVPATPNIADAILYARSLQIPTVYEIDDLIFDKRSYPDDRESYGGLITSEEYAGLVTGVPLFYQAMKMCDYGIASTPALAHHMEQVVRSGICHIHRNALGIDNSTELDCDVTSRLVQRDNVTIFYGSGTKAHNSDFEELAAPALLRVMEAHDRVRLVIVGYLELSEAFDPYRERIQQIDVVSDVGSYWELLKCADINLAVLKSGAMNHCKSEIKWLEAAAYGVPSVVSDTETYTQILEQGQTALIAATPENWFTHLSSLVQDPNLRHRIGKNAQRAALANYSPTAMGRNLARIVEAVCEGASGDVSSVRRANASKPKILIVNVFFPPQAIGGATRVVRDNVDVLLDRYNDRYNLMVFTANEGNPDPYQVDRYDYRGIPVTRISTPQEAGMDWRWENPEVGRVFAELLEREKPNLIHFHCIQRLTSSVVDEARKAGVPYLITVHDAWWISDHQFLVDEEGQVCGATDSFTVVATSKRPMESLQRLAVLKKALAGADAVLAVSESFADIYKKAGVGNVVAVPNGLPEQIYKAERKPSVSGRVRLAHIGGISMHKGFHLVRRALLANKYRNLELTVVDHAASNGSVRYEQWGTTPVRIIGKVPQEQIHQLYTETDVLLAPSIWPESYGLVTREAIAAGLWVVASNRGAIGEDVRDGLNGALIDVTDSRGLAQALSLIDAAAAKYLRAPSYQAQLRTVSDQVQQLVTQYDNILENKRTCLAEQGKST